LPEQKKKLDADTATQPSLPLYLTILRVAASSHSAIVHSACQSMKCTEQPSA
jgi:hypothetical protein